MRSSDKHMLRFIGIWCLLGGSFLGLALTQVVQWLFFDSQKQMMEHPFWSGVVYAFSIVFVFAGAVLIPVQILYFGRKLRASKPLAKMSAADAVGLPFGAYNPDAEVPRWIKVPILIVLYVLLAIVALIVVAGVAAFLFPPE